VRIDPNPPPPGYPFSSSPGTGLQFAEYFCTGMAINAGWVFGNRRAAISKVWKYRPIHSQLRDVESCGKGTDGPVGATPPPHLILCNLASNNTGRCGQIHRPQMMPQITSFNRYPNWPAWKELATGNIGKCRPLDITSHPTENQR